MKTILVPVDYSAAAKNAVYYALGIAQQMNAGSLLLYNAFQPPVPVDSMSITTDGNFNTLGLYDMEALTESNKIHLERLKAEVLETYQGSLEITTFSEFNMLREGIEEICRKHPIALIVMGISEADSFTETLVGSNSLDVAKNTTTPVIIVPEDAEYQPVKHILFTCDYKKVSETVPVALLKNILASTGAHLHVLHVDADAETDEHRQQAARLQQLLQGVAADYHQVQHDDFKTAVNTFAANYYIDLIVAIPKKHGFFEGLFHQSHTKTLAFHSHLPLLLMHDE